MIQFIEATRNSDRYIETIYMEGGCYQFHLLLKHLFPGSEPYINRNGDHIATLYNGKLYDIRGEVTGSYQIMTEAEKQLASNWSFAKNMVLHIAECPACGEPILV